MTHTVATWPLHRRRPAISVRLQVATPPFPQRRLLADTGGGPVDAPYELILSEEDCLLFGPAPLGAARLGGAYSGVFLVYSVGILLPELGLRRWIGAVAVPGSELPPGFDGIAAFRFLNGLTYGNFGRPNQFGLTLPQSRE